MIKFFRQIRQDLLSVNKLSKYLVYAVGEILLVVIGILIALSINNWNEHQKLNDRETSIAKELHIELNENLVSVKKQLELWENRDEKISEMISLIDSKELNISNREFDSILISIISFDDFKLKQSKFQRIISLENFNFLESPSLMTRMLDLNNLYTTLNSYYNSNADSYNNELHPYLINNYSLENFDSILMGKKKESKVNFKVLLFDLKFANLIHSARGNSAPFVQRIKITIRKIETLIKELESIYPDIPAH